MGQGVLLGEAGKMHGDMQRSAGSSNGCLGTSCVLGTDPPVLIHHLVPSCTLTIHDGRSY
jgi:hypothetical protein